MKKLIDLYLEAKASTWAPSTLKPVKSRLALINEAYLPADPLALYKELTAKGYGAYTVKQVMLLATQVAKHGAATTETYTAFMQNRKRLFANAYAPKKVPLSFEEALEKIGIMPDRSREFALGLIVSGLRISEASKVDADGQVVGKGNKLRSVPNAEMVTSSPVGVSLDTFRRDLKAATGLTPQQLRKLAATKMAKLGAREADLCAMLGWASFQTASIYLQAENVADVTARLKGAVSNAK